MPCFHSDEKINIVIGLLFEYISDIKIVHLNKLYAFCFAELSTRT